MKIIKLIFWSGSSIDNDDLTVFAQGSGLGPRLEGFYLLHN